MGDPAESRDQVSAGGVVVRPAGGAQDADPRAYELLVGEQLDRNTASVTLRLPKGHIDPGESGREAALREVREETGRNARVRAELGAVEYAFYERALGLQIRKRVVFFLMDDAGAAGEQRDREMQRVLWIPLAEAADRLSFDTEREVVARASTWLAGDRRPQGETR